MIYLLTGVVRSGKTTRLLEWSKNRRDVAGILTPDRRQRRVLLDVRTGSEHPFQVQSKAESVISIGRFTFSARTFEIGRAILKREREADCRWLIIDEIGPLELRGKGFEPEVEATIRFFKNHAPQRNLILVIRDTLKDAALKHYGLTDPVIFNFP
ncbi:hypothetical protein Calab_3218 [Caldithrix abyssi DSM 13497]|uniref:NTPase n=1 Tax=Caldithrix abyssi DSM 13497 TaxID=880073 RepID=H1XUZ0_CALAY|nr:nucleoside-triphosphatase [Caldithrix abyssi]APF18851.1 NTPase [Caldithrix abyssi DSM 13497]EHO42823.1 hypothetical protein Calab_3218 [Caldithrix abyssi DSM 13497]